MTGKTTVEMLRERGIDPKDILSFEGRINQYVCSTCNHVTTTIDRDAGVTPFLIECKGMAPCAAGRVGVRMKNGRDTARSLGYSKRVDPEATPTHEWYRPETLDEVSDLGVREHILNGGLLLRPIGKRNDEND